MLDAPTTQALFGELVGIGQPAVSDLLSRGVLRPGQTAGQWLMDYCAHLREQAAGRGADGELASNRAKESATRNQLLEMKLAIARKEYAAVDVLGQVLATVGRSIAGILEPLHVNLHKLCPALTPEDIKVIQLEVSKACDIAVSASLAVLDVAEDASDVVDEVPAADGPDFPDS